MSESSPQRSRTFWEHVQSSLRGEQHDYTRGSLHTAILLLAVPMVLEMGLESTFALVDIWWVNQIDTGMFGATSTGGAAAAAVGATEAMLSIVFAVSMGLAMAVTALVARRVGENDLDGAARVGGQAMGLGLLVGALLGVPALVFAPELLGWMSEGKADVVEVGTGYTRWVLGGNVIVTLLFLQNAIFRGAGDPILALKTLAVANGINLLLDPCLIFGLGPFPELGVTGAGVATCIGRSVAVVYQFWLLRRGRGRIQLQRAVQWDWAPIRQILDLSFGTIFQFLIGTTSWVVLMRMIGVFATEVAAGYTTGFRILMFALLPAWGISNAAATLVGQNLGAGQPERAERSVWLTGLYNMGFLAVVTLLMEALPWPIVAAFTDEPNVQHTPWRRCASWRPATSSTAGAWSACRRSTALATRARRRGSPSGASGCSNSASRGCWRSNSSSGRTASTGRSRSPSRASRWRRCCCSDVAPGRP